MVTTWHSLRLEKKVLVYYAIKQDILKEQYNNMFANILYYPISSNEYIYKHTTIYLFNIESLIKYQPETKSYVHNMYTAIWTDWWTTLALDLSIVLVTVYSVSQKDLTHTIDIFEHNSLENKYFNLSFGWDINDQHRRDQAKFGLIPYKCPICRFVLVILQWEMDYFST